MPVNLQAIQTCRPNYSMPPQDHRSHRLYIYRSAQDSTAADSCQHGSRTKPWNKATHELLLCEIERNRSELAVDIKAASNAKYNMKLVIC